jgi:rRNA-processing protein FCF1
MIVQDDLMYEIMLDTNTLDYIYTKKIRLVPKLSNFPKKHIHLYITQVQQDEINKMTDDYRKSCINKIISIIGIRRVLTSGTIIGIDESSKHGFIGSNIGMCELVNDADLQILENLQKYTRSNPMSNTADLLILYTSIKKKMDYLITDDNHFGPMLKEISKFIPNHLQLRKNCDLDNF